MKDEDKDLVLIDMLKFKDKTSFSPVYRNRFYTLSLWYDIWENPNIKAVAEKAGCHRNTVPKRLKKIEEEFPHFFAEVKRYRNQSLQEYKNKSIPLQPVHYSEKMDPFVKERF